MAEIADDCSDIPPLEDMSPILQKLQLLKDIKGKTETNTENLGQSNAKQTSQRLSTQINADKQKPNVDAGTTGSFGGLKKGFLFSSKATTADSNHQTSSSGSHNPKENPNDLSSLPHIKPNKETEESRYRFDEVQQAMSFSEALSVNKDDWLTDDLLRRIQSKPELLQQLADPTFMTAIAEFQANPQTAMLKYQHNTAVQSFLKDFCGILGEHFSSIGSQPSTTTGSTSAPDQAKTSFSKPSSADNDMVAVSSKVYSKQATSRSSSEASNAAVTSNSVQADAAGDDDDRVKLILADPEMKQILLDEGVQQLIAALRTDPDKAQRMLLKADADFRIKIQRLVQSGLLQFQR